MRSTILLNELENQKKQQEEEKKEFIFEPISQVEVDNESSLFYSSIEETSKQEDDDSDNDGLSKNKSSVDSFDFD